MPSSSSPLVQSSTPSLTQSIGIVKPSSQVNSSSPIESSSSPPEQSSIPSFTQSIGIDSPSSQMNWSSEPHGSSSSETVNGRATTSPASTPVKSELTLSSVRTYIFITVSSSPISSIAISKYSISPALLNAIFIAGISSTSPSS